jgi:hypothetical protein
MTGPLFVHFPFHDHGTIHPTIQGSAGERSPHGIQSERRQLVGRTATEAPIGARRYASRHSVASF